MLVHQTIWTSDSLTKGLMFQVLFLSNLAKFFAKTLSIYFLMKIKSFQCPSSIRNYEKEILGTSGAWLQSHLSHWPSKPANIVHRWISKPPVCSCQFCCCQETNCKIYPTVEGYHFPNPKFPPVSQRRSHRGAPKLGIKSTKSDMNYQHY